jgi:KaiC/GvpD/RAD55 family RecA-like ATPase
MSERPQMPIESIDPGTMLVVGSSELDRARTLATFLVSMGCSTDDGVLFVSTDTHRQDLLGQYARFEPDSGATRMQLIDARDEQHDESDFDVPVEEMSSSDLSNLGIKFSVVYENLSATGCQRVLAGVHTLSSILYKNDLRTVVRFLNTVANRTRNDGGLVVFVIDSGAHDAEALSTLSEVCDGYIEIRGTEADANKIRIHDLPDQPEGWLTIPAALMDSST